MGFTAILCSLRRDRRWYTSFVKPRKGNLLKLEVLRQTLDSHYRNIDSIILSRQDPVTGLLPASTAVNAHGDYTDAWVRDNVYSILGVWGLAQAYRRWDPDHYRSYLLSQSVVKLMRGLLGAMMHQADRVEAFKNSLNPNDALHAKYGTHTGLPVVGDTDWGHLQLDATSLYLLMIAQMTAAGLRIIFTLDEVNFIQNLVHYISRTFCTPDYGIWERGNKTNHGMTEINCSSVGMAKAALEALSGFNLFGNVASQDAIVHVIPSDVARSRFTLESLLPRESNSKETDAALLSIIGYPAYAIEDAQLVEKTRGKIIKKLAGRYGCKRFLLDGHQTALEDESRLHYEPSELKQFAHIESEWPLFFTYLLLDAIMRHDQDAVAHWQAKLEPLFVERDGQRLLPELYKVPETAIEAEREAPGSQARIPNENVPLVWAQSLYMLSAMILDGILRPSDIDPLRRRERIGHARNTQILVAVLAENQTVKQQLYDLGFGSETLQEVAPVRVLHARQLSQVHAQLGKNAKLGLTGRPLLATRTVTTSRLHLLEGEEIIFLPYYFNPRGFYFNYDTDLLVEQFRSSLAFLSRHWDQPGQPIISFLVRQGMLDDDARTIVLELLNECQQGACDSAQVKTGPLVQLLSTAAVERVDYLHGFVLRDSGLQTAPQELMSDLLIQAAQPSLTADQLKALEDERDAELLVLLQANPDLRFQAEALRLLDQRLGGHFETQFNDDRLSLRAIAERLYDKACAVKDWAVVRRLAEQTGRSDERLEDALLDIVVRQKQLAVGRAYSEKAIFSKPVDHAGMLKTIAEFCGNNPAESVLTQEILLHLGHLIRSEPDLFDNMLTLRTWYFVQLLVGQIARDRKLPIGEAYNQLLTLAPHTVFQNLRAILKSFKTEVVRLQDQESLHASGIPTIASPEPVANSDEVTMGAAKDWAEWRLQAGLIGHLPPRFYKDVWYLLRQCHGLVIGDKYSLQNRLGTELTHDSTAGERAFALRIDSQLQSFSAPDYRQLNIEVLESLARFFRQNPELKLESDLVLDVIIGHAVRIAWEKSHPGFSGDYEEHKGQAWEAFYRLSPQAADAAFIEALMYLLTPQTELVAGAR